MCVWHRIPLAQEGDTSSLSGGLLELQTAVVEGIIRGLYTKEVHLVHEIKALHTCSAEVE